MINIFTPNVLMLPGRVIVKGELIESSSTTHQSSVDMEEKRVVQRKVVWPMSNPKNGQRDQLDAALSVQLLAEKLSYWLDCFAHPNSSADPPSVRSRPPGFHPSFLSLSFTVHYPPLSFGRSSALSRRRVSITVH
jgi:hypothetical protein